MPNIIGTGDEHKPSDYYTSSEQTTLLDLVKCVGFIVLIFTPGILAEYLYPNTWISVLAPMIPIVIFAFIILWIMGVLRR